MRHAWPLVLTLKVDIRTLLKARIDRPGPHAETMLAPTQGDHATLQRGLSM